MRSPSLAVGAVVCAMLAGCAAEADHAGFPAHGRIDYQLGGAYDPADPVDLVTRDSSAAPLPGAYSVCYVNGFQTQPGDADRWNPDLFLRDATGEPVIDPNWPDEFVLDPSSPEKRAGILDVIGSVIDGCRASGFDAVEIDNLDTYTRFPELINRQGAFDLAGSYAERAHAAGIAIGQKNAADDAEYLKQSVGFDFATAEECSYFDECDSYAQVYGDNVIDVEYTDALRGSVDDVCASPDRIGMTVVRDRNLVAPGSPDYFYRAC